MYRLERVNMQQVHIDGLRLRTHVKCEFLYHNIGGANSRKKHVSGYDVYMNSKLLASMARRERKNSQGKKGHHYSIIDANSGKVLFTLHENQVAKKVRNLTARGVRVEVRMS